MMLDAIRQVGVAGAGVMGQGIAALFAQHGYPVVLYDPVEAALENALTRIGKTLQKAHDKQLLSAEALQAATAAVRTTSDLAQLQADLIVEAAPERLDVKHALLRELERHNAPEAVIATNTSSISVTRIAAVLTHPQRCLGMHFFNPVAAMKLVEVIAGAQTTPELTQQVAALARQLGKTPVVVRDAPGFIVNRVARPFYLEAQRIVEETGADIATVDAAMEAAGFRMGPFRLMDLIGIDTNHEVSQRMFEAFFQEPRFRPSRLQQRMVDAGLTGRKQGRGWYEYGDASV